MPYNLGSGVKTGTGGSGGTASNPNRFGRVVDVIMDPFHPRYNEFDQSQSLYGVLYRPLGKKREESEDEPTNFAYFAGGNIKQIPLKGEIVELTAYPNSKRKLPSSTKVYWTKIIPLWNHVNHNAYPDTLQFTDQETKADLGEYFEESDKVNNLQLFPGDLSFEGRHGNTLRFGGTKFDSNELTDDSNSGFPYTILRNGQAEAGDATDLVVEDINEDLSSLYLVSDHTVPLEQAHEKRDGFNEEPEKADVYKGNQVLLNSGRLYFNAKEEGAYISAKDSIGLNAKVIGIDSDDYIGLDSKKIYLGTTAFDEEEPALKGQTSTDWLDDLVSLLEGLAKTMATTPPAPPTYIAALVKEGAKLQVQLPKLKSVLKQLHSKKVYIDNK